MTDPQVERDKSNPIEFLAKFDSTVLAGLVFLALGGGIISFYYSHISYLPDIEWSQSIVHLATATLIGGGLAILLALSLFLPGCMWSAFLLRDDRLKECFWFHEKKSEEVCLWTLLTNVGLPFGAVLLANHIVLVLLEKYWQDSLSYAYGIACVILLIPVGLWIRFNLEKMLKRRCPTKEKSQRLFKYIAWFLLSIILSQLSMLLIYLFSGRPTGKAFWTTTIFCTLGVFISNHFVAIHYERSRIQSVLVSVVIAALLLFVADRNSNLSVQVLAFFGLGEKSASVDLVLSKEGEEARAKLGLPERCTEKPEERLCNVKILSRLGNEYLLKADDQIFTLPKSAVISRMSRPLDQEK